MTTIISTILAVTVTATSLHAIAPRNTAPSNTQILRVADDGHAMHHMKPVKAGSLEISSAVARATLPNQPVAGGYLVIKNTGSVTDTLTGGSAPFAGKVEVHEMAMENDVMKMRALDGGLEIPAGSEVTLKPGGLHIMFMGLNEPLKEGEMRKVTLEFENAGTVDLDFMVKKIKPGDHKMDHSGHKMEMKSE